MECSDCCTSFSLVHSSETQSICLSTRFMESNLLHSLKEKKNSKKFKKLKLKLTKYWTYEPLFLTPQKIMK